MFLLKAQIRTEVQEVIVGKVVDLVSNIKIIAAEILTGWTFMI